MQTKDSIYSYIINVLTLAKVYKAELALNQKIESLDKIISLSLDALNKFEELDLLNPHQELSLKIALIIKNDKDEYLLKKTKKGEESIKISPSLNSTLEDTISDFLNKNLADIPFNYEIKDLINIADLKENGLVKENYNVPTFILCVKINGHSSKILNIKDFTYTKDLSNLNKLDSYIIKKGE